MPITLNFKICDNSPDCSGIVVCSTKAFYFDKKNKTLVIDNNKCIDCGKCVSTCPVGAIKFAKNLIELKKIQQEIDLDPRGLSDLFVDRYGAEPQAKEFFCSVDKFNIQILQSTKLVVLECFDEESIHCLIKSIPIKELFLNKNIVYRKFAIEEELFKQQYNITKLPCLLFFNKGKLVGNIQGFYSVENKKDLISLINKLL